MKNLSNFYKGVNEKNLRLVEKAIIILNNIYGAKTAEIFNGTIRINGTALIKKDYITKIASIKENTAIEVIENILKGLEKKYRYAFDSYNDDSKNKECVNSEKIAYDFETSLSNEDIIKRGSIFFSNPSKLEILEEKKILYIKGKKQTKHLFPKAVMTLIVSDNFYSPENVLTVYKSLKKTTTIKNYLEDKVISDDVIVIPGVNENHVLVSKDKIREFESAINGILGSKAFKIHDGKMLMCGANITKGKFAILYQEFRINGTDALSKSIIEEYPNLIKKIPFRCGSNNLEKARADFKSKIYELRKKIVKIKTLSSEDKRKVERYLIRIDRSGNFKNIFKMINEKDVLSDFNESAYYYNVKFKNTYLKGVYSFHGDAFKFEWTRENNNQILIEKIIKDLDREYHLAYDDFIESVSSLVNSAMNDEYMKGLNKFGEFIVSREEFTSYVTGVKEEIIQKVFGNQAKLNNKNGTENFINNFSFESFAEYKEKRFVIDEFINKKVLLDVFSTTLSKVSIKSSHERKLRDVMYSAQTKSIVKLVKEFDKKGITTYVSILSGEESCKYKKDAPYFGVLKGAKKTEITNQIELLIEAGILEKVNRKASFGRYTSIEINKELDKKKLDEILTGKAFLNKQLTIYEYVSNIDKFKSLEFYGEERGMVIVENTKELKFFVDSIKYNYEFYRKNWEAVVSNMKYDKNKLIPLLNLKTKTSETKEIRNAYVYIKRKEDTINGEL